MCFRNIINKCLNNIRRCCIYMMHIVGCCIVMMMMVGGGGGGWEFGDSFDEAVLKFNVIS